MGAGEAPDVLRHRKMVALAELRDLLNTSAAGSLTMDERERLGKVFREQLGDETTEVLLGDVDFAATPRKAALHRIQQAMNVVEAER